jgi:phage-related minor tail protein
VAKRIQGITIQLDGETKGLDKSLKSVNKRSQELQAELRDVERLLKFSPGNTDLIAQKQKLLANQIGVTSEKLQQLKDAEKQVQDQFKKGEIKEEQYRAFQREIAETESKLNTFENKLESTQKKAKTFGDKMKDASEKVKDAGESFRNAGEGTSAAGDSLTQNLTLPLVGFGTLAGKAASDHEAAHGKIRAQLGLSAEESKEFEKVATNLWKNAFGEDMNEAAEGVATVAKNMQYLESGELEKAAKFAFILRDAFGVELVESTKTADQLMAHFGLTASDSFDLITKGFQNGLDFSGEWLDTLNEYAPQFAALGMSAEDMFNQLAAGADAGAFNLDKVGDAAKEFNIRIKDGSKTTSESMKQLSKGTQSLWKEFQKGEATGGEVMQAIIADLSKMDNEVKSSQIGVGLFGTQWEDLETDVIKALGSGMEFLGDFKGSTQEAGDALYNNFGSRLTSAWREMQIALIPLGEILLKLAEEWLPKISSSIQSLSEWFTNLSPAGQQLTLVIAGIVAGLGPLLIVVGTVITLLGSLAMAAGALNIAMLPLTGIIAGIVLAIAGLVAAGIYLYKNWDTISKNFQTSIKDLSTIGSSYMEMLKKNMSIIWNFIKGTFSNALSFIKALVTRDVSGMKQVVSDQMDLIGDTFTKIWNNVMSFLKGIKLKGVGKDIMQGLLDGIIAKAEALYKKASQIASNIKKTIKKALDINSPSRVMRDEVGKWIPAGIADGIEGNLGVIGKSVNRMSSAMKPDMPELNGGGLSTPQSITHSPSITIQNMSVRDDSDIKKIARELHNLTKMSGRRVGTV